MTAALRIAAVTMVRNEPLFLPIWIGHWSATLPRQHLFILLDGVDQDLPPEVSGCQVLALPRSPPGPGWDRRRWDMLAAFAATLLGRFDVVVTNDVDELLVPDPAQGASLTECLGRAAGGGVVTPFGVEIIHRRDLEPVPLDPALPILAQRRHARINASYCKPCVLGRRLRWSMGGHQADHPQLSLDPALYLFHLRYVDRDRLMARQSQRLEITATTRPGQEIAAGGGWDRSLVQLEAFLDSFETKPPEAESAWGFSWQRQRFQDSWAQREDGFWGHDRRHNHRSYRIPDRFVGGF